MKKATLVSIMVLILLTSPVKVFAHSGRTDSSGCHNCYTSYCYGEYHCHGGGSSYSAPVAPRYILPIPINPSSGNISEKISSTNWCNYDVNLDWEKTGNADRYSVAASKTAGADPGPLPDTFDTRFTIKNLTPGKWYINLKSGNSEQWSNNITYWTLNLPKPTPHLYASLNGNILEYDISCLKTVQGPQEFIDHLKQYDNVPKSYIVLNYATSTEITIKGKDFSGKEYTQDLNYIPPVKTIQADANANTTPSDSNSDDKWIYLAFLAGLFGWGVIRSARNKG